MVDFTNTSKDMMNVNSVISLFARMDSMYKQIIGQLVDLEDPEIADFLAENMPALNDYILEICNASERDPEIDAIYSENCPVDMEELMDLCDFFDFDPKKCFILKD